MGRPLSQRGVGRPSSAVAGTTHCLAAYLSEVSHKTIFGGQACVRSYPLLQAWNATAIAAATGTGVPLGMQFKGPALDSPPKPNAAAKKAARRFKARHG